MKITVLTMFPDLFSSIKKSPLWQRAIAKNKLDLKIVDLRSYSNGSFRANDESPYGGGAGMLIRYDLIHQAFNDFKTYKKIALCAQGEVFNQSYAKSLSKEEEILLLCGHYEGIDQRALQECDLSLSIGDYILSGGEIAAMAVIDSLVRLLPEVIKDNSLEKESFDNNLLEYPQYCRPSEYNNKKVPDILLSGNHEAIRKWKIKESIKVTLKNRPDLFLKKEFNKEEFELLLEVLSENK